jgi:hypothetical protein
MDTLEELRKEIEQAKLDKKKRMREADARFRAKMTPEERNRRNKLRVEWGQRQLADSPEAREARRVYQAEYIRTNRDRLVAKNRAVSLERKKMLVEKFGGKCLDCGGIFPLAVYHFHHMEPSTKNKEIGKMMTGDFQALLDEASKCIMLCANCHIIRHNSND